MIESIKESIKMNIIQCIEIVIDCNNTN